MHAELCASSIRLHIYDIEGVAKVNLACDPRSLWKSTMLTKYENEGTSESRKLVLNVVKSEPEVSYNHTPKVRDSSTNVAAHEFTCSYPHQQVSIDRFNSSRN